MKRKRKLIVAGGSGFMGEHLVQALAAEFDRVVVLTRGEPKTNGKVAYANWDGQHFGKWAQEIEGADCLVNLCGRTVDCRYNEKNKKEIFSSRINSTLALGAAVIASFNPPKVWVNVSSATIYRHEEQRYMDEYEGVLGEGFSVDVCKKWEDTFNGIPVPGTRKIALRAALVLGKKGGVFQRLKTLTKMGLGGSHGSGVQKVSWVHEDDFVNMIRFCFENENAKGAINCAAPHPVCNKRFMHYLRAQFNTAIAIPLPEALVKMGTKIMGTEAELVLKSRYVYPTKIKRLGYKFRYPNLGKALTHLAQ